MSATPTAMKKYNETYNTENFQLDWEKIYSLSFQTTLDTKLREFQYKVLNRICYTNKMLFNFRIVDSPLCYFCNEEIETLEHFFFYCERVRIFWNEVNNILQSQKLFSIPFDVKDIFFGMVHTVNNKVLINYIILEGKYSIYRSKLNKSPLFISLFLEKCKRTYQIERFIARNNKLYIFTIKNGSPYSHFWINSYHKSPSCIPSLLSFSFRTTQIFLVKIALQINNFSRVSIISNITIIISNVMITRRSVVT